MNLKFFKAGIILILVYVPISFFLGILFEMIPLLIAGFGIIVSVTILINELTKTYQIKEETKWVTTSNRGTISKPLVTKATHSNNAKTTLHQQAEQ